MAEQVKEGTLVHQQPQNEHAVMEVQSLERAQETFKKLQAFIKAQMVKDRDFGTIPGCKKPSLYKPGAEKLLNFHGLACRLLPGEGTMASREDIKGGFVQYVYKAEIYNPRTGLVLAVSEGSCNNGESKYKTQDLKSILNTLMKMAQKRAMIGATLMACRASDSFTDAEEPQDATATGENRQKSATSGLKKISDGQRKLVYARFKGANIDETKFKEYLKTLGFNGTEEIDASQLDTVLAWIEKNNPANQDAQ